LGFFVDLGKDFVGSPVLVKQKAEGPPTKLSALLMAEKGPPLRPHYPVFIGDQQIAETCSGGVSPSLGSGIALAYLPAEHAKIGGAVEVEIRGRRFPCQIVKKPFYKKA
jgi:aminomethyltransferase